MQDIDLEEKARRLEWAMRRVWQSPVRGVSARLVLLALTWIAYSRGQDFARVALPKLCEMTGSAINTVRTALKALETQGLVVRLGREGRSAQSYRLVFGKGTLPSPVVLSDVSIGVFAPSFSEDVLRELKSIRAGLIPREAAAVRSKAVKLAKERLGSGYSIEAVDVLEMEIVLAEFVGPHRREVLLKR